MLTTNNSFLEPSHSSGQSRSSDDDGDETRDHGQRLEEVAPDDALDASLQGQRKQLKRTNQFKIQLIDWHSMNDSLRKLSILCRLMEWNID